MGEIASLLIRFGTCESNQLMSTSAAVNPKTDPVFPKVREGLRVCSANTLWLSSKWEFVFDFTVPQKFAR